MKSGIETVLDLIHFDDRPDGMDLVVTREGRTDWQSCFGKLMQGVGVRARNRGIPVAGLSGSLGKEALNICDWGIFSIMTSVNSPMPLQDVKTLTKNSIPPSNRLTPPLSDIMAVLN